jgi:hypothetical protein
MLIDIEVNKRIIRINAAQKIDARLSWNKKRRLFGDLSNELKLKTIPYDPETNLRIRDVTLSQQIERYSEEIIRAPILTIIDWYSSKLKPVHQPGYATLGYRKKLLDKNAAKGATGSIGEGVAGLIMQRCYHARFLCRPQNEMPDIIMAGPKPNCLNTYLVESKAHTKKSDKTPNNGEIGHLIGLTASSSQYDIRPVIGVFMITYIETPRFFKTFITQIEVD